MHHAQELPAIDRVQHRQCAARQHALLPGRGRWEHKVQEWGGGVLEETFPAAPFLRFLRVNILKLANEKSGMHDTDAFNSGI